MTDDAFASRDVVEPSGSGPLDGWDVAVKDMIAIAGRPSSSGLVPPLIEENRADASVVADLAAAGARIAGTTAMHQLACGVTGINDFQGTPTNPRWPNRVPGGSSSGSAAAVASGTVRAAIGTDTGGSVRIPAACCGVVGVKPSRGAISLDGVLPCAPSLDHVGVFAASVADASSVLRALGVEVEGGAEGTIRFGVAAAALAAADDVVRRAVEDHIAPLATVPAELPDPDRVAATSTSVLLGEFARVHADLPDDRRRDLGDDILGRLERGAAISDGELDAALADLAALEAEVRLVLETVDAIVLPTLPSPAPLIDDARRDPMGSAAMLVANTRLANCTGLPALSLPVAGELPVGLQLIAATESDLFAAASALDAGGV